MVSCIGHISRLGKAAHAFPGNQVRAQAESRDVLRILIQTSGLSQSKRY